MRLFWTGKYLCFHMMMDLVLLHYKTNGITITSLVKEFPVTVLLFRIFILFLQLPSSHILGLLFLIYLCTFCTSDPYMSWEMEAIKYITALHLWEAKNCFCKSLLGCHKKRMQFILKSMFRCYAGTNMHIIHTPARYVKVEIDI